MVKGASGSRQAVDQAAKLRELSANKLEEALPILPAIAVTGGKGGVGKTCIAVNLAVALAELGAKPLLVDFDLGLANADVLLGLRPTITLAEVMEGRSKLSDALIQGPKGMGFIPAASGREELTRLSGRQLARLFRDLSSLAKPFELLVLDTAAGIGREVSFTLRASRVVLVVVTPEPTSLADAYALIKVLEADAPGRDVRVLVNQAADADEASETFARLRKVTRAYLKRDVVLTGFIPRDRRVGEAVRARKTFILGGDGPAAQAIRALAVSLRAERWRTS